LHRRWPLEPAVVLLRMPEAVRRSRQERLPSNSSIKLHSDVLCAVHSYRTCTKSKFGPMLMTSHTRTRGGGRGGGGGAG
jgi:hypothetical protein